MVFSSLKDRVRFVVGGTPKLFADKANVSLPALYSYMSGRRVPSALVLYRISKASGQSMEWFLDGNAEAGGVEAQAGQA